MQVRLLYFAIVREMIGEREETLNLPDGSCLRHVLDRLEQQHPALHRLRPSLMFMVNEEYANPDHELRDGDEIALIPPVSGGDMARYRITEDPIASEDVADLVSSPGSGAIVTFLGTVRDNARGRRVTLLEYEAYAPAAVKMLARIGEEIDSRWGIKNIAIVHRIGSLGVGEVSVAIAVSAAHRGDAFEACQYAIDRIKEIVPIWKKEHYDEGEAWIGSEAEYQAAFGTSARGSKQSPPGNS